MFTGYRFDDEAIKNGSAKRLPTFNKIAACQITRVFDQGYF